MGEMRIVISHHGLYRRDGFQFNDDIEAADVACVQDEIDSGKCLVNFWPYQPVCV